MTGFVNLLTGTTPSRPQWRGADSPLVEWALTVRQSEPFVSLQLPTAHCHLLNSAIRNPQFKIPSVFGNLRILFCYEPD